MKRPPMPYFDQIFDRIQQRDAGNLVRAMGSRHVHWGDYQQPPSPTDASLEGFIAAAEALTLRVCDAGSPVTSGMRILDAGCGFGGTIASLNERLHALDLVGLNIDERQVERARALVAPRPGNQIRFVHGDACVLPFEDASFDRVLAVECIFHFPGRRRFFKEAARVLRPGGRLSLCDFVPYGPTLPLLGMYSMVFGRALARFFGHSNHVPCPRTAYAILARTTGFRLDVNQDITRNTLPTYAVLRRLLREGGFPASERSARYFEWLARSGLLRYRVLSFTRAGGPLAPRLASVPPPTPAPAREESAGARGRATLRVPG